VGISFAVLDVCVCVCVCVFVCLFVRLRISPPSTKLAASHFARRFIGIQGRESDIFVNFDPPEAQNRTNRKARGPRPSAGNNVNITVEMRMRRRIRHARDAPFVNRAACGRRIGMCGYRSVPLTYLFYFCWFLISFESIVIPQFQQIEGF